MCSDGSGDDVLLSWVAGSAPGEWVEGAACAGLPSAWFVPGLPGAAGAAALAICATCRVRSECLAYALARPGLPGVWGGTSMADRARLLARDGPRRSEWV